MARVPVEPYGWRPDLETPQPGTQLARTTSLATPPASASLVPWCPPILDQGPYNTCVAHALIFGMETAKIKRGDYASESFSYLSRLQHYFDERELTGNTANDSGSSISGALIMMANRGVAPEPMWDYTKPITLMPTPSVYTEAAKTLLTSWAQLGNDIVSVKQALAADNPVVIGLHLRRSFIYARSNGGVVPMPSVTEPNVGEHAVCLVGYGSLPGYFTFANSKGQNWGDDGFGYLPEAVIGDANFSASYWAIQDQT